MSTYTDSLGLEEITPGDQAGLWGNTTNNNLALIDQAVTGVTPLSFAGLSGTVKTLETANGALDEARAAVLNITGNATGANTIVVPNKQKTYLVRNSTGQIINFRTASPGEIYPVGAGFSILIFCDGNNNVFTGILAPNVGPTLVTGGGTGVSTFGAGGFVKSPGGTGNLTSAASVALGADVSGVLPVSNGGTGAGVFTSGSLIVGNGTSNFGTLVGGGVGQVATWNGSTWTAATPTTSAVASVFGRTGTVTAQATDYSAFYAATSSLSSYALLSGASFTGTVSSNGLVTCTNAGGYSALQSNNLAIGNFTNTISSTNSGNIFYFNVAGNFASVYFSTGGNFQASNSPNWSTVSDANIKTNLRPISSALRKINSLNPTHFEYKDKLGKTQTGFIAQEFETIFPGHTIETDAPEQYKQYLPEGQKTIKALDINLTAYLVKAIQELSAKIDAQAEEIAALKAK